MSTPPASLLTSERPLAITMWDFSWLERRWDGAGYEDWDRALDELGERGYDAVRIDAYPHLVQAGAHNRWELLPVWDQEDWGASEPTSVVVLPALLDFLAACRDRNLRVALSSWFRQDTADTRMRLRTPDALAEAWSHTLTEIEQAGLGETIYLVDLVNEWPHPLWAPFLYEQGTSASRSPRGDQRVTAWGKAAVAALRKNHPGYRYTMSFSQELWGSPGEDVSELDVLDLHVWFTAHPDSDFYKRIGYNLADSRFDPSTYQSLSGPAESLFRSDPDHWLTHLRELVNGCAQWSRAVDKPLISTECWSVINYKDGPQRDWGWVQEMCQAGVVAAIETGRWEALATSNFCGPQFVGMWRDIAWHQRLTDTIHRGVTPRHSAAAVDTRWE